MIIAAGPDDWPRTRDVRLRALRTDPDAFVRQWADEAEQPDDFWRQRLDSAFCTLLATVDGRDVGMAVLARPDQDMGLFGVWVAPEHRGSGVGHALVAEAIERARASGAPRLVLVVADHCGPARALYARLGFRPTGDSSPFPGGPPGARQHELALTLTV